MAENNTNTGGTVPPKSPSADGENGPPVTGAAGATTPNNLTFDLWIKISETMNIIRTNLKASIPNKVNEIGKGYTEISKGFTSLEASLTDLAKSHFACVDEVKKLRTELDLLTGKIDLNEASGNLSSKVEDSTAYKDLCKEIDNSASITKIPNFKFDKDLKGGKDISNAAKTILNTKEIDISKTNGLFALAKETNVKENNVTAPVLIKCVDPRERQKLDRDLRAKGFNVAYHWPKPIFNCIKTMRDQICKYKADDLDLTNSDILIRPKMGSNGKTLNISYRVKGTTTQWNFLCSTNTPAPPPLLTSMNLPQVASSKFFKL